MPKKQSHITITDQFCGCGGSSQGASEAFANDKGVEIKLALNHWKLAIETHNTNFPETLHECTDISACDPRRYPSTDFLLTSPECTNHSLAKGKKQVKSQMELFDKHVIDPAAERSRATMWDVPRFAEYHGYNIIIVENVVDARKWIMWDAWLLAMHSLGYNHHCVYLNSMFCYPTPQSRDRMYVVFWKKGNKAPDLNFYPKAFCNKCNQDVLSVQSWKNPQKKFGKYGRKNGQYVYCCPTCTSIVDPYYYAAFNCIDWSNLGKRIGDRAKALSKNTVTRIQHGIDKYWDNPFLIHAAYSEHARGVVRDTTQPMFSQTTFSSQALVNPFIINNQQSTGVDCRVKSVEEHFQSITTQTNMNVLFPFIMKQEHMFNEHPDHVKSILDGFETQTTRQSFAMTTYPFLIEQKKTSLSRSVADKISCITTTPYHGLVTDEAFKSFISCFNGNGADAHITDPSNCVTTKDRLSLINYSKPNIDDCYFRMLQPKEVQRAMAFGDGYIVLGSGKDQVKQLGNAVTPPAMKWLVRQCIQSLN